ncbi:MAG: autotransporter outer membrane beta-barrel domain-containing protein, partial [Desulfarculales bacterium]|nr:autotransporter outer membrane beta-barrel domain-containing protein [Desulfarculales bacterium]
IYGLALEVDPVTGLLRGTVTTGGATEQAKALSEGFLGGAVLINQGADLIAGQGMASAVKAARAGSGGDAYGLAAFATVSGGSLRYNSGSHVDMSSLSLLAGLAKGVELKAGLLTLGAFFEYGNGSYDTYNSFSNAAAVHGEGDIHHTGGGILGRLDFMPSQILDGSGNFYAEASARAGGVSNQYSSNDLQAPAGGRAEYDSSSAYYGLHLGLGYVWNLTEAASLDFYGKYFWTRQEGDSVTLSTGDPVTFKDVDSQRLRLGGRFAYAVNEYVSPYIGAAYEHEFDGRARATTNGFAIDAPSLQGSSGVGELGLSLKPSQTLPLSFDLGVQGYVGKREGVTGSLQVKVEF